MYTYHVTDGYLYITIKTNLVIGEHDQLEFFIQENMTPDNKGVILDLLGTDYIDSSGISTILRIRKMLSDVSKDLRLLIDNERMEKVIRVSRLDKILITAKDMDTLMEDVINEEEDEFSVKEYKLVIPSEYIYIRVVQDFVLKIMQNTYNYSSTDEYDVKMSLEETLANSIEHGYKDFELDGLIQVLVLCHAEEMIVFIDDYGKGYDKDSIIEKVNTSLNDPYGNRGRGFVILHGITDEIHYDSVENKVSSVIIVKKMKIKE
ncbi:MAG: ATP-binding protein [Candidatus Muiribacteriaceae bacterium]